MEDKHMHFVWQCCGFIWRRIETQNADQFSLFVFLNAKCRQKPLNTISQTWKPKKNNQKIEKNKDNQWRTKTMRTKTQHMNNYIFRIKDKKTKNKQWKLQNQMNNPVGTNKRKLENKKQLIKTNDTVKKPTQKQVKAKKNKLKSKKSRWKRVKTPKKWEQITENQR